MANKGGIIKGILKAAAGLALAGTIATGLFFGGRTIYHFSNGYKDVHPLVDNKTIVRELEENFDSPKELFVYEDFLRLPVPVNQETIKINITFTPTERYKRAMEECVKEYNDIFAFINPIYKFELNLNPSKEDLKNPYYIDVQTEPLVNIQNFTGSPTVSAYNKRVPANETLKIDKKEIYHSEIHLPEESLSDCKNFIHIFKHELAHSLGLNDIKNIDDKYATTSMMSFRSDTRLTELHDNDIRILYSLYRPIGEAYSQEKLDAYLESHRGKFDYPTFAKEEFKYCFTEEYIDELRDYISTSIASYVGEQGKENVLKAMEGETDIDKNFGNEPLVFVSAKTKPLGNLFPIYYTLGEDGLRMQKFYNNKKGVSDREDKIVEIVKHDGIIDIYNEDGELYHYFKVGQMVLGFEDPIWRFTSNPEDAFMSVPAFFILTDKSYEEYKENCHDALIKYYEEQEAPKTQGEEMER